MVHEPPQGGFMKATLPSAAGTKELAIFGRLLRNGKGMTAQLARYVLTLGFTSEDQARMTDLASRNQENGLSADEKEDLMSYVKVGHLLALLHAHARQALKKPPHS
jgi:hypothetical protein